MFGLHGLAMNLLGIHLTRKPISPISEIFVCEFIFVVSNLPEFRPVQNFGADHWLKKWFSAMIICPSLFCDFLPSAFLFLFFSTSPDTWARLEGNLSPSMGCPIPPQVLSRYHIWGIPLQVRWGYHWWWARMAISPPPPLVLRSNGGAVYERNSDNSFCISPPSNSWTGGRLPWRGGSISNPTLFASLLPSHHGCPSPKMTSSPNWIGGAQGRVPSLLKGMKPTPSWFSLEPKRVSPLVCHALLPWKKESQPSVAFFYEPIVPFPTPVNWSEP